MVKRSVVGAHYGVRDWLIQRVTAAYMALYTVAFAFATLTLPALSYESWRGLFSGRGMQLATFLFFAALCYHAWIGMRDIWMDYVKPLGVRLLLHAVTVLLLVGYLAWVARVLWRL
ncbi:MAG: succinate dehydrogenase, hydrophobic membrane anchor protein [Hydrogenophilus sp.]|nr:succinate dehydrogenase, hydrophobic membrane anchor protein [Hydrogenophilus sp.]